MKPPNAQISLHKVLIARASVGRQAVDREALDRAAHAEGQRHEHVVGLHRGAVGERQRRAAHVVLYGRDRGVQPHVHAWK